MPESTRETVLDPSRPLSEARSPARLLAVYEVGRELLLQREPHAVIRTILAAIVRHLEPDHACVLAVDAGGRYRPLAAHKLDLGKPEAEWPLSRTVLRRAREDAVAVLALDSQSDQRFGEAESVQRLQIRSTMCVPLGKAPVHGLVYLDNRSRRPFTRDDLDFLTAVSLYASLVLERAREHEQTASALRASDERLALLRGELLRHEIVGRSRGLLAAYDELRRFAVTGARVLLRGETGTGKELFARAYAAESGRASSYVPVPIPALAPSLVESELFGHARGAFTEATRDRKGRLELADKGVLFLDEVGDIEPGVQVKLLRFLDSGELHRVGDNEARRVDALVVSATNRPLEEDVALGRFRPDLLARLGHPIVIPPLRERPDDIPLLVAHFLAQYERGRAARKCFADDTLRVLERHRWPYNVRELQQVVERVCCLVDRDTVLPEDLPDYIRREENAHAPSEGAAAAPSAGPGVPGASAEQPAFRPLRDVVLEAERAHIVRALEAAKGNKRRAIELLQLSSETFYRRLDECGLRKKDAQ